MQIVQEQLSVHAVVAPEPLATLLKHVLSIYTRFIARHSGARVGRNDDVYDLCRY